MLRHWLHPQTLRGRLRLINLASVSLAFALLIVLVLAFSAYALYRDARSDAVVKATVLAENVAPAVLFNDTKAAEQTLQSLSHSPEVLSAVVYDRAGRHFAHYATQTGLAQEVIPPRLRYDKGIHWDGRHLDTVVPVLSEMGESGALLLTSDLLPILMQLLTFAGIMMAAGGLALVVGTSLQGHLQDRVTRRLAELADLMKRVSREKDYSQRAVVLSRRDEIGSLAQSFNRMLEQIQIRDGELGTELQERRSAEKKLQKLANFDTLTHLPNRLYFNEHLRHQLADLDPAQGSLGLMFIDLDNFKYVNDTFGHHAGDALLVTVSQRLRESLRSGDVICRLGGDEFAVVLEHVGQISQAETIAGKMIDAVAKPIDIEGNQVYVGASIGITLAPEHANDAETLIRHADAAMYRAKQAGKNQHVVWLPEMGAILTRRFQLESGLRNALGRNELSLHYQPVYQLQDNRLIGMEALLRWKHGELGAISPDEFIPIAEETGQIATIGMWVIETAARQLAQWRKRHPGLRVSVNLSTRQFIDAALADQIAETIGAFGLPPHAMELEITEGLMLDASSRAASTLNRFAELGMNLSLDDFGTGYSSLSYLGRYTFSKIKIDRSFVMALESAKENTEIILAILGMARALNMQVVAEGIETENQRAWLASVGCQLGQGYHYSRPLNVEAMTALLEGLEPIQADKPAATSHLKLVS